MYFLRVDDYPAWTETMDEFIPSSDFEKFHDVLTKHRIPYMVGVTPQPALTPLNLRDHRTRQLTDEECNFLRRISGDGAMIGLHGVTHHTRRNNAHSEFADIDDLFFEELVRYADVELERQIGKRGDVFVPPFNRITWPQLEILARRFRVICGGPESDGALARRATGNLPAGSVYLPSRYPYYGRAHEILEHIGHDGREPICLTLHWEWERRRGYQELDRLCRALEGQVSDWGVLFGG